MSSIVGLWLTVGVIGLSSTGATELTFTVQRPEQVQTFASSGEAQLALLAQTSGMNIRVNKLTGRIKRHTHPQSHHFLYLIQPSRERLYGRGGKQGKEEHDGHLLSSQGSGAFRGDRRQRTSTLAQVPGVVQRGL